MLLPHRPLLLTAMAICIAAPAWGQEGGSADPDFEGNAGAIVINGLSVIERQDLDFGVIAPSVTTPGTVKVNRGSNNDMDCSTDLTCLEIGHRARFNVVGEPDRYYTITNPGQVTIVDGGGNFMTVDGFFGAGSGNDTEWRGLQKLRPTGIARFNVGAVLHVKANQPPGTYAGTFVLTIEYQ
ncbi:MAG: DUF4402 domain-containing protein [Pseudomonadota bacterium]